jgi:hypothetical protein
MTRPAHPLFVSVASRSHSHPRQGQGRPHKIDPRDSGTPPKHPAQRSEPARGLSKDTDSRSPALFRHVHAREDASKSIDEVLRLLQNLESARAEGDRARIAALGPSDTPLALVREHLPLRGSFGIALRERTRFPVRSVRCAAPLTVHTVSGTSCRSSE